MHWTVSCKSTGSYFFTRPIPSAVLNEYLAIGSGGYLWMNSINLQCVECFQDKSRWFDWICLIEQLSLPGSKLWCPLSSPKDFDVVLYKNVPLYFTKGSSACLVWYITYVFVANVFIVWMHYFQFWFLYLNIYIYYNVRQILLINIFM